jgi:hypothetical protein
MQSEVRPTKGALDDFLTFAAGQLTGKPAGHRLRDLPSPHRALVESLVAATGGVFPRHPTAEELLVFALSAARPCPGVDLGALGDIGRELARVGHGGELAAHQLRTLAFLVERMPHPRLLTPAWLVAALAPLATAEVPLPPGSEPVPLVPHPKNVATRRNFVNKLAEGAFLLVLRAKDGVETAPPPLPEPQFSALVTLLAAELNLERAAGPLAVAERESLCATVFANPARTGLVARPPRVTAAIFTLSVLATRADRLRLLPDLEAALLSRGVALADYFAACAASQAARPGPMDTDV